MGANNFATAIRDRATGLFLGLILRAESGLPCGSIVEALAAAPVPANHPANAAPASIAFVVNWRSPVLVLGLRRTSFAPYGVLSQSYSLIHGENL
jgi:hypothetical protein